MSEWCTLHAKVANNEKLPNEEKITNDIKTQCNHSRTKIHNNELYILIMENNVEPVKEFVKKHQEAFNTVGISKGNNYGFGSHSNDKVTFYDVQNDRQNKIKTSECSSKYNGSQVISTSVKWSLFPQEATSEKGGKDTKPNIYYGIVRKLK